MRGLAALLLFLCSCPVASNHDVEAKLRLLRQLADEPVPSRPSFSGGSGPAPSAGLKLPAFVKAKASDFGRHWRKREMSEASASLRQLGSALSEMGRQQHGQPAEAIGVIASSCEEYSGYLIFAGMEDGSHADYPRLLDALFHLFWTLAELSGRISLPPGIPSSGLAVLMKPGDLRSLAKEVVNAADAGTAGGDPERVLLARYSIGHTLFVEGKLEKASTAVEAAVAAIAAADEHSSGAAAADVSVTRLMLTSLHVLYAHVLLGQGQRQAAVERCAALASTDGDFNLVYRCILPLIPLPVANCNINTIFFLLKMQR